MQGLFYQPRSLTWWIKIQQFLCCYHTHCGTSLTTSSHFICSVFLKSVIPTPVHISWYPHRLSYPQYISCKSNTGQKGIQAADGPGWFMVCMNTQSTHGACVQPWPAPRVAEASLYCHADLLYHSLSMIWWCRKLMDANGYWGYNSSQLQHALRKTLAPTPVSWCSFAAVWQLTTHSHAFLETPTLSFPPKQTHRKPNTSWKEWSSQALIAPKQRSTTRSQRNTACIATSMIQTHWIN